MPRPRDVFHFSDVVFFLLLDAVWRNEFYDIPLGSAVLNLIVCTEWMEILCIFLNSLFILRFAE